MSYYRELARDIGSGAAEQNGAFVAGGGTQSLPAGRNAVVHRRANNLPVNIGPGIDGYDELFDSAVEADYECPICMMCLRDPVQTACGHRFCKSCLQRHMRSNGPTCPSDNQQIQSCDIFDDNFAKREINQFTVKCRTVKNGKECPWKGELHKIENHLTTCEFLDVSCANGCGRSVERRAFDNHVKNECPKRILSCYHCNTDLQHRNLKGHLQRCPKVLVKCQQCDKMLLREKLGVHGKKCPKGQEFCKFKGYGCKWVGLRSDLPAHLHTDHLHLPFSPAAAFLPNGRKKLTEKIGTLEQLNRKAKEDADQMKANREKIEREFRDIIALSEHQQAPARGTERGTATAEVAANNIAVLEARFSNGVFMWRITGVSRLLENARQGLTTVVFSPHFYTASYKFCLRVDFNGVDTGNGLHLSLFVHMMQSEMDDTLECPFSGRFFLAILDQRDDGEYKRHISETLVTRPNLLAFQRPTTSRNHKEYGYVEFAHLETLQEWQYVKNDCLLVRVQVYN